MIKSIAMMALSGGLFLETTRASGVHERYNPYGYLSPSEATVPATTPSFPTSSSPISDLSPATPLTSLVTTSLPTTSLLLPTVTSTPFPLSTDSLARRPALPRASTSALSSLDTNLSISTSFDSSASLTSIPTVPTESVSSPTPTSSASGISIVGVQPPPSTGPVSYLANGFFANWHALNPTDPSFSSNTGPGTAGRTYTLDDVKWELLDSLTYGYIPIPISNFTNIPLNLQDVAMLPKFVAKAHHKNVTSILSFGGHIGSPMTGGSASTGFSLALASDESIQEFVQGVANLVKGLGLGGVEFDWEWTPCSTETPYTSSGLSTSYLSFLKQLRAELGNNTTISLAVGPLPFETPQQITGNQTSDTPIVSSGLTGITNLTDGATVATTLNGEFKNVSDFASVVDYITIMNFDLHGPWSSQSEVLPNSPLNRTCPLPVPSSSTFGSPITGTTSAEGSSSIPLQALPISAKTAIASWALSGFRTDQIVLGVSASGRSYRVAPADAFSSAGETLSPTPPAIGEPGSDGTTTVTVTKTKTVTTTPVVLPTSKPVGSVSTAMSTSTPRLGVGLDDPTNSTTTPFGNSTDVSNMLLALYPPFNTTVASDEEALSLRTLLGDAWWWSDVAAPSTTNGDNSTNVLTSTASVGFPSSTFAFSISSTSGSFVASSNSVIRRTVRASSSTSRATGTSTDSTLATSGFTDPITDSSAPPDSLSATPTSSLPMGTDTALPGFPSDPTTSPTETCSLPTDISSISGVFSFQGLIDAGFLDQDGDPSECPSSDGTPSAIVGGWDECSETPFVYNARTNIMVSYDDAESMELKGAFILETGLRGFSLYELGADSSTARLLTAIRRGAGFPEPDKCISEGEEGDLWTIAHANQTEATVEDEQMKWISILQDGVDLMMTSPTVEPPSLPTETGLPFPISTGSVGMSSTMDATITSGLSFTQSASITSPSGSVVATPTASADGSSLDGISRRKLFRWKRS